MDLHCEATYCLLNFRIEITTSDPAPHLGLHTNQCFSIDFRRRSDKSRHEFISADVVNSNCLDFVILFIGTINKSEYLATYWSSNSGHYLSSLPFDLCPDILFVEGPLTSNNYCLSAYFLYNFRCYFLRSKYFSILRLLLSCSLVFLLYF